MLVRSLLLALFVAPGAPAFAASLKLVAVDYGVPGDPYASPLLPGEEGDLFVTLVNESEEVLRKVSLSLYPGDCVESVQRDPFVIASVGSKETIRVNDPVRIKIKASCPREKPASFLLIGTYQDLNGMDQRIWAEVPFAVAPFPAVNFLTESLNLVIPTIGTVAYDFEIASALTIRQIGVYVKFEHSYMGDIKIILQHPSGQTVLLRDRRTGNGLAELRLGLDGDSFPALNALLNLPASGTWRLIVDDRVNGDSGMLHSVGLKIR